MAIVEVTTFRVAEGRESAFQQAMDDALPILARQPGYLGHEFGPSVEESRLSCLIVRWTRLEDHVDVFRGSPAFEEFVGSFRRLLSEPASISHFRLT
jgi:heme-degrading monooxygenase HmoA